MKMNMKKWTAWLLSLMMILTAATALGDTYTTMTYGSLDGYKDALEITSDDCANHSTVLVGTTIELRANEDYAPTWASSDYNMAEVESGSDGRTATVTILAEGELTITATVGEQTDVYSLTIVDPNPEEKDGEKKTIMVAINMGSELVAYDGTEHVYAAYSATSNYSAFDPAKVTTTRDISVKGTECGYYQTALTPEDFKYEDEKVNAMFMVSDGYMKITPAKVTVMADNLIKEVDEEDPELTATVTGLVNGEEITYTLSRAEGEEAGTYPITVEGEEIQGNYRVTYTPGTLTITSLDETKPFYIVRYVIDGQYTKSGAEEKLRDDVKKFYDPLNLTYSEGAVMFEHYTPDEIVKEGMITKAFGDVVKFVYAPETIKYTVIRQTTEGEEISTEEIDGYYGQLVNVETKLEGYKFIESDKELEFELTGSTTIVLSYKSSVTVQELDITANIDSGETVYMGMEIVLTAVISEGDAGYTELQWQYSQDGKNWEDVADAKGISYSYELNEETAPLWWRVMATRTEEE